MEDSLHEAQRQVLEHDLNMFFQQQNDCSHGMALLFFAPLDLMAFAKWNLPLG